MQIHECMKRNVVSIPATATVGQAAARFAARRIGMLPVVDDSGRLLGLLQLRDLLALVMPDFVRLVEDFDFVHDFGAVETRQPSPEATARPVREVMQPPVSVFLDNVTTVVLIAPVTILISEILGISAVPLLVAEALLSNTGGVATLVGDPPNIPIASAAGLSFNDFLTHSLPIVAACWLTALGLLRYLFRAELGGQPASAQVSGGQRQRVAVARAIAVQAEVLLMDEPLSNLDALLRLEMRAELKRLLKEVNTTVVYVTHDQVEALSLGDRIAVMQDGSILQCDTPLKVYDFPANDFVGGFIGNPPMNFLEGRVTAEDGAVGVAVEAAVFRPPPEIQAALRDTSEVWLGIRSENIQPLPSPAEGALAGQVLVVEPLGSHNLLTVVVGAGRVKVNAHADSGFRPGQAVWLRLAVDKIRWMEREKGRALGPA